MSRKSIIILVVGSLVILIPVIIYVVWLLTQETTQVAPTDSDASTTVWCGHCPQDENGNYINCCSEGFNGDPECTNFNGEGCFKLYTDDDPACLPASNKDYSGSVEKTYVFFCESLSCTMSGGVLAKRCDNQNKIAVFEESGRVDDTCSVLTDGKLNGKPCGCFAYQVDWVGSGTDADGWKMGEASLSGADCEPPVEVPPTCTVTNSAQCVVDGTDVSADVTWNVTEANFPITNEKADGFVVLRLNDLEDENEQGTNWFVQLHDTWWATYYQEFITSGLDPKGATWNFDVRNSEQGEYDAVVAGVDYDVYAAVYEKDGDTVPVCTGVPVKFNCDLPVVVPVCGDDTCNQTSETCENNQSCTTPTETVSCRSDCTYCGDGIIQTGEECDDGNKVDTDQCSNVCKKITIVQEPYCGDNVCNQTSEQCENNLSCDTGDTVSCRGNCTYCGDGIENGNEQCDDGNDVDTDECRNDCSFPSCGDGTTDPGEECDDGNSVDDDACSNDCKVPQPPEWEIDKVGDPSCSTGKDVYGTVLYKVTVTNTGLGDGVLDRVVDTLDAKVDPSWVDTDSMVPSGTLAGNVITWTLSVADSTFAPGESKEFVYTVTVPSTSFGSYSNTAEGFPVTEASFSVTNVTNVTCTVDGVAGPLPETGIFDSTIGRVGVGLLLISLSSAYVYFDGIDRVMMKFFFKDERYRFAKEDFEKGIDD